ncbi:MAG: hypothetical protein P1V36_17580 [Planctomycetota bacterium]|nr:hypothetical protein [Planctomycetota bacterium]
MARLLLLLILLAAPAAAWGDSAREAFDPRFREGAPSDLIVDGTPRLSRGHLNAYVDLFEASFDVALPRQTEILLREALAKGFRAAAAGERQRFLDLVDNIVEIRRCARCCHGRGVRACLRAFRRAVDQRMNAAPDDPAHRIVRHVLERRHSVVWLGIPEVKDLAAVAYLETVVFVASLGRGEAIRLSPGQISALKDYLDRDLRRLSESVRDRLALSHRQWLLVKARWDRGRDARRLAMRWQAVRLMARLVPKNGGHTVGEGTDLAAYAREAARLKAADRGFDAVTALARNPELLQQALDDGLALGRGVPAFTFMYR